MKKYQYNCVACPDVDELNFIIDNEQQITYQTFRKNVDKEELKELIKDLGYSRDFPITDDWHVSYHKSKTEDGKTVYFLCHSAIEYVFY